MLIPGSYLCGRQPGRKAGIKFTSSPVDAMRGSDRTLGAGCVVVSADGIYTAVVSDLLTCVLRDEDRHFIDEPVGSGNPDLVWIRLVTLALMSLANTKKLVFISRTIALLHLGATQ
jgi:hypothetical protein